MKSDALEEYIKEARSFDIDRMHGMRVRMKISMALTVLLIDDNCTGFWLSQL